MKRIQITLGLLLVITVTTSLRAQISAFTYQGRLDLNGTPANGHYDFMFRLLNDSTNGVAAPVIPINLAVPVTNGRFTTGMDFGAENFNGANRWLEINVRTNGGGPFTTLSPRQLLTPAPYAIAANTASNLLGALPASQISGTILNASLPASPSFSGTVTANNFSGSGAGLTNGNASTFFTSGTLPDARLPQASYVSSGVLPTTYDFGRIQVSGLRARIHRVPPMGMDTWYLTGVNHNDALIRGYIDIAYTNGLVDLGWKYISITEGWQGGRTNGVLMPDGTKYPDITNTIAYAHARGMKVRIYTEPSPLTSAGLPGSPQPYFANDLRAFDSWGVDDVQFDIIAPPGTTGYDMGQKANILREFITVMRDVVDRPMTVYSGGFRSERLFGSLGFSNFNAMEISWAPDTWRAVGDLGAGETPPGYHNAWTNYIDEFVGSSLEIQHTISIGQWYQIDHLFLQGGAMDATNATRGTFAMHAILSSPMFVAIFTGPEDPFRYSILTNRTMLRVAQDAAGFPATVAYSNATQRIFVRQLSDDTKAVAFMNHVTNATTDALLTAAMCGFPSNTPLYYVDAWGGTSGFWTNTLAHTIPKMTADLFHVWRADTAPGYGTEWASLRKVPEALSNLTALSSNSYVGTFTGSGGGLTNVTARLVVSDQITVALTSDNQPVSTSNRGYIALSSNATIPANRTFVLSSGAKGQLLDLEWIGTNAGELLDGSANSDSGNVRLSANWTPTQHDMLSLRFNGTDWIERNRSVN